MSISLQSRRRYHPRLGADGLFAGGERAHRERLDIIEREVDVSGKSVLDLGCSGGFFSFSLAPRAARIVAVDADRSVIEQNRDAARRLGRSNIEFVCERITPQFLDALGQYDVVLFLSVFHHILVNSDTYDWTDAQGASSATALLRAVAARVKDTYVFEMGRPDESFDWATKVRARIGEPRQWVPEHVFGPAFAQVQVLPGAAHARWPYRWLRAGEQTSPLSRLARKAHRVLGVDQRDFREIYVGRRARSAS